MAEQLEVLKRVEALVGAILRAIIAKDLETHLADPKRKRLYRLTGTGTVRELAKKTGYSIGQISTIWQEWEALGLVLKDGQRYKRVV